MSQARAVDLYDLYYADTGVVETSDETVQPTAWMPQPGMQEKAIRAAFVPELFVGGSRGPGKTSFLVGDFASEVQEFGSAWRGIIFRRTYPELDEVVEEGKKVLYKAFPGTQYKVGVHEFRIPHATGDVTMRLRHIESEGDADHYQGHQYCVAKDTQVWMSDGSSKPIQDIRAGEMVATLEGPRRVTATHDVGRKECVAVYRGADLIQKHPIDHPVLTNASWQSYTSALENGATASSQTSQVDGKPRRVGVLAVSAKPPPWTTYPQHSSAARPTQYALGPGRCAPSPDCTAAPWPPPVSPPLGLPPGRQAASENRLASTLLGVTGGSACVPLGWGINAGFPVDYSSCRHPHGARPPAPSGSAPDGAPSPGDVASRALAYCMQDDPGSTPSHTQPCGLWYAHPYTGALRYCPDQTSSVALTMIPCGEEEVYDLTVEDVNHYITGDERLVNRNSWIGWDELTNWSDLGAYHKLKATLRPPNAVMPVKRLRIRATGNPGGPGHMVVKEYFVDAGPPDTLIEDDQSTMPRMWIPGLLDENQILLKVDPDYKERLKSVGDPELVRAWLEGDWNVAVGAFFNNLRPKDICIPSFAIPDSWPIFASMDYGEAQPTVFLLWTVDYDGTVYIICEYYQAGAAASQHAYEIDRMIRGCPFTNGRWPSQIFADPSMWAKRRLTEVVQTSPYDVFQDQGLHLSKANNDRITGWRAINDCLAKERLFFFKEWTDKTVEEMASVPRSKTNPEDVDTHAPDHGADAVRYGMMHIYQPQLPQLAAVKNPFYGSNVLKGLEPKKGKRRA